VVLVARNRGEAAVNVIVEKKALLSALHGAKELYPDEFTALFKGESKKGELRITDLLITPFAEYGRSRSSYSPWFVPSASGTVASFHSHPSGPALPSRQDLVFFAEGYAVNFIAAAPYGLRDVAAFDNKGKRVAFTLID